MKASEVKVARRPPRVVTLPVACFVEAWAGRPTGPIKVGLRRASAGETELASKEAVVTTDKLLPGYPHEDPEWKRAYDIALLHILLSYTLTSPEDIDRPLWPQMDGTEWIGRLDTSEGLSIVRNPTGKVVSRRFTVDGIGRLYDEMHVLKLENNPLWPELDDEELEELGEHIRDGSFLAPLRQGPDDETEEEADQRKGTMREIRRMIGYLTILREERLQRPAPPVEPKAKKGPIRG